MVSADKVSARQLNQLKSKIPRGKKLPTGFQPFLSSKLPLRIAWNSLQPYGFDDSAEQEMVPFLHIADGSLVAMWFGSDPPAVVLIDSHGERPRIVAKDFPNFLRALSASKTGVSDIDEDCVGITIPRYATKASKSGVAALQRKLDAWSDSKSSLRPPTKSPDGEFLRVQAFQIAEKMILDGRCKVYSVGNDWEPDDYWDMDFRIQRKRSGLLIEYRDLGKWHKVPANYKLEAVVVGLLELVKNPKASVYELAVTTDGLVSIDNDKQLVLEPD